MVTTSMLLFRKTGGTLLRVRRWYTIFRVLGYACGLLGMLLFTWGYRQSPTNRMLCGAGGVLLIVMFVAFLVTYVLFVASRLKRRQKS